jgi:hypothetical protein
VFTIRRYGSGNLLLAVRIRTGGSGNGITGERPDGTTDPVVVLPSLGLVYKTEEFYRVRGITGFGTTQFEPVGRHGWRYGEASNIKNEQ